MEMAKAKKPKRVPFRTWVQGLTVTERLELARKTLEGVSNVAHFLVNLHESNEILLKTDTISKQIPYSYAGTFNYPHFGLSGSACLTGTNRDSVVGTSSSVRGVPWIGFRLGFPVILPIPACRACAGLSPIRQGKAARELGHHEGAPPCHPSRRGG
jgi:hypothetical protein